AFGFGELQQNLSDDVGGGLDAHERPPGWSRASSPTSVPAGSGAHRRSNHLLSSGCTFLQSAPGVAVGMLGFAANAIRAGHRNS
ncbi:hypothetical protein, partial [Nocardia farcinica]|uniref:hypothetical protein n=1 Tax=Nocardia farcinica TaxID=37329 RepID=UPI001C0F3339